MEDSISIETPVQVESELAQLPRHDFMMLPNISILTPEESETVRFSRSNAEETEKVANRLRKDIAGAAEIFGSPLTEEQKEMAATLSSNMESWALSTLGIDLSQRRPAIPHIRRLVKDDEYDEEAISKWGFITQTHFTVIPDLDPSDFHGENDPQQMGLRNMSHEFVHSYGSQIWVVPHPEEKHEGILQHFEYGKTVTYGFAVLPLSPGNGKRDRSLFALNEAVTESMNIELLSKLKEETGKDLLTNLPFGYVGEVVMFDMIFDQMAEKLQRTPEEMKREIYSMYYKGRAPITRLLAQAFGHETANLIAQLDQESENYITLAAETQTNSKHENPPYANILKVMENTGVNPEKYTEKIFDIFYNRDISITGTSGPITFRPGML